ncbi:DNA translocase FtsK 4TM domain-containing protein, partial [Rhodopseudomonas sp. B29]|uniref:DNA translocase FtsK 4TM domain-containing protein n=1 Tax=Rhodopseudomonas sp. B29 TaxID=95607 RepID=UPI0003B30B37
MAAIERVIPLVGHLPISVRDALGRRLRELMGLSLIALAALGAGALASWSVQDPSLSHATSRTIHNWLGYGGAIGADLSMQILGLGAIGLLMPIAVWGWRMLHHRPFDRRALRLAAWILCTILASGFASSFPRDGAWPLPTGFGGVVGDALVRTPSLVFGPGLIFHIVLSLLLGVLMLAAFVMASGYGAHEIEPEEIAADDLPFEEEEESDRGSVSLGWMVHALLSAKARLTRLIKLSYRGLVSSAPTKPTGAFERQEPRLGGRTAPPIVPQLEDHDPGYDDEAEADAEEDEEEEAPAARAPRKKPAPKPTKKPAKFELPAVAMLTAPKATDRQTHSKAELEANSRALEGVLQDFGVRGEIIKA